MGDKSDFNDLKKSRGGLHAVKSQVSAAVDSAKGVPFGPFLIRSNGVFVATGKESDTGEPEVKPFCSRLTPIGITSNEKGTDFAILMEITDPDGKHRNILLKMEDTVNRGGELARALFVRNGGTFAPGIRSKVLFNDLLNSIMRSAKNLPRLTISDTSGWVTLANGTRAYVLPGVGFTPRERSKK